MLRKTNFKVIKGIRIVYQGFFNPENARNIYNFSISTTLLSKLSACKF